METIEGFKPLLIGKDPARIEHTWQTLFRGGFFPAGHARYYYSVAVRPETQPDTLFTNPPTQYRIFCHREASS